ncbi:MAG: undecaprenyl-phosphate glucose phosphotransferase [Bacteroidota bacterium]|nr:undecaprenyl-phosphate glucose phosphotransferase [Bacteroidota bacterium]
MPGKRYTNRVKFAFLLNDLVALNFAFFLSTFFFQNNTWSNPKQTTFLLILNLIWIVLASYGDIYSVQRVIKTEKELNKALFIWLLHFLMISIIVYYSKVFDFNTQNKIVFYLVFGITLTIWKITSIKFIRYLRMRGLNFSRIAIIGGGLVGDQIRSFLMSDHSFGIHYLGLFDDNPDKCLHKDEIIGTVDDFKTLAPIRQIDEVFIALPNNAKKKIADIIRFCDANAIRIKIVPDFMRFIKPKVQLDFYGSIPIILLHNEPLASLRNRFLKRSVDFLFSFFVIVFILSWLLPILAVLIKIDSKGPVFFKQKRTGNENNEFYIWKLRSMRLNGDADKVQATKGDKRITRLGSFLRKSNLDELPQFFNILKGDMSLIGPRPHMLEHTAQYSAIIKGYMVRHFAKPGLTGWAQVNGFRGETREPCQMEARVEHDVYYIENWSIYLDNKIFFRTIYNMIKGEENAG